MRALTSAVAAGSLIAGFAVAQATGVRPLGGLVLLAGGAWCGYRWWRAAGPVPAVASVAVCGTAFVVSHPLAGQIGAWPSVLVVSAVAGGLTYALTAPREVAAEALSRTASGA